MDADSVFLDIQDFGKGPIVVFTHGWAHNRNAWDGVIDRLGKEIRSISWSLRGHGDSEAPPPGQYTRDHTMSDLARVIPDTGQKVVLAGHSLGGYLSLAHCLKHPEQVKGLVLIAAGPGFRKEETREQWNTSVTEGAKKMDIPEGSEAAALHTDSWVIDSLGEITVPTLVIVGERDKRFAASMAVFEKYLNVTSSIVVPDAGHSVHSKNPEPVAEAIRNFLSEIEHGQ
ncbi:MAG: alpha/beta hydrolase [Acidimicrobiales bacterium]|jgi:pimeloyl-ACP methyl ester carboxylesterase|nr:alpha/beta hydrolase [Acidimicrobiales bacterium]HJM27996.1 alpha/beta hydrolase [Acidimicrobiales bacterium]HJM97373.1 alpha/beta hydrolase [Acidimicrobiales bacterium]